MDFQSDRKKWISSALATLAKHENELVPIFNGIYTLKERALEVAKEIKLLENEVLLEELKDEIKDGVGVRSKPVCSDPETEALRQIDIAQNAIDTIREEFKSPETERDSQESLISTLYVIIETITKDLLKEKKIEVEKLRQELEQLKCYVETKGNETLKTDQTEMFTNVSQEKPGQNGEKGGASPLPGLLPWLPNAADQV